MNNFGPNIDPEGTPHKMPKLLNYSHPASQIAAFLSDTSNSQSNSKTTPPPPPAYLRLFQFADQSVMIYSNECCL